MNIVYIKTTVTGARACTRIYNKVKRFHPFLRFERSAVLQIIGRMFGAFPFLH